MSPEQQLVQQIQQLLASQQLERNPMLEDLALQFSEMCDAANSRLARCGDYLDKGMRSEAVHEAHNLPDLLALAALVEFEGVKKWRNLCADMELTVFQPLNQTLLARLKNAVSQEREMEPLLKEYRRCVYQGDHRSCIELLRKIREKDSDNPSWAVNLKPLEEEALPELVAQTERALAKDDLVRLKQLFNELTHPQRVVNPPEELMRRLKRALLSERAADLKNQASALITKLHNAVEQRDSTQIEMILEKTEALLKDDAFLEKPDRWDKTISEAKEFLEEMIKRRGRQEEFLSAVDNIQEMLSKGGCSELELRHDWERLLAWELPISDLLRKQVEETLADMQARRKRRTRSIVIVTSVIAVILIGANVLFLTYKVREEQRATLLARMEQLFENGQLGELELFLEQTRQSNPAFAQSPKVEDLKRRLQEKLQKADALKTTFNSLLEQLNNLRSNHYEGLDKEAILMKLKDAEAAAKEMGDNGALSKIKNWRGGWEEWMGRRAQHANNEVKIVVAAIQTALDEVAKRPYNDFDREREKITELKSQAANAEPYSSYAGDMERTTFKAAIERLDAWERDCQTRSQAMGKTEAELATLRKSIPNTLPDLVRYKAQLTRYVEIAPNGDALKNGAQLLLEHFLTYQGALALGDWDIAKVPPAKEDIGKIDSLLGENGAANDTVWARDLFRARELARINTALQGKFNSLLNANPEWINLYYLRYRPKGTTEWIRLYSQRPLIKGPDPDDNQVAIYWGNVYFAKEEDGIPILMHTKLAFPNKLNSNEYDIEMELKKEDNRCEYAKFLFKLITEGAEAKNYPVFILESIQKVFDNNTVEPVLRALLVKRLIALLKDDFVDLLPELRDMERAFASIDTNAPWMNAKNPAVKKAAAKLENAISSCQSISALTQRLKDDADVLKAALGAKLSCVGSCQMDAEGNLKLVINSGRGSNEIWGVFKRNSNAAPVFMIISDDGSTIRDDAVRFCIPGMPVFAPALGRRVQETVKRLELTPKKLVNLNKPASWPENAWK